MQPGQRQAGRQAVGEEGVPRETSVALAASVLYVRGSESRVSCRLAR